MVKIQTLEGGLFHVLQTFDPVTARHCDRHQISALH